MQFSRCRVFKHDAVGDFVVGEEVSVGQSGEALFGIDDFDWLIGMATEDRAILQEVVVMHRGLAEDDRQDKAVLSTNSRVLLLEPKVRLFIFDGPVVLQIAREIQLLAVLIFLAFISIAICKFLFQLIIAKRSAGRFNQAGIHGHALVDGKPLGFELTKDLGILPRYKFKSMLAEYSFARLNSRIRIA